jgi:aspartyl-tRNA(Asn)/glutamyl-tRNA(Gln) amidotransferase subunit B
MPEPPDVRRRRLQGDWGYSDMEMRDVMNAGAVLLIEETVAAGATPVGARKWWMGELARRASAEARDLADFGVTPADIAELDGLVGAGRLNDSMARQVLEGVLAGEGSPVAVADARGLQLVDDDDALSAVVDKVIAANPQAADKVREGKVQAAGALIGQVMKEMRGQADAARARELILAKLGAS